MCEDNRIEVGKLVAKNTNVGYMKLVDGKIKLFGFGGLMDHKVKIEVRNGVMLLTPDNSLAGTECVKFTDEALSSEIMINYFKEQEVLNCLFVRVFSVWTQCKGVYIE